jgi:hypothetical protein
VPRTPKHPFTHSAFVTKHHPSLFISVGSYLHINAYKLIYTSSNTLHRSAQPSFIAAVDNFVKMALAKKTANKTISDDDDGDLMLHLACSKSKGTVDMTVSSKHLMFSSPAFKAMFRPGFHEEELLRSRNLAEVDLPEDDAEAFEI